MSVRVPSMCEQCGQVDDHPKAQTVELGSGGAQVAVTKHHDCLSVREKQILVDAAQEAGSGPKNSAVIAACEAGTRGDKLLQLIQSGDLPQAEGVHHQAQLKEDAQ